MHPTESSTRAPTTSGALRIRVDSIALAVAFADTDGTRFAVAPAAAVTASRHATLPVFGAWVARGALTVHLRGQATAPFDAQLDLGGTRLGARTAVSTDPVTGDFSIELSAPLSSLPPVSGTSVKLGVHVGALDRVLNLTRTTLSNVPGPAPQLLAFDVREITDALLFNAPERKLFDLSNPEEGFWMGTGRWRLRAVLDWAVREQSGGPTGAPASTPSTPSTPSTTSAPAGSNATPLRASTPSASYPTWSVDPRPLHVQHGHEREGTRADLLFEDATLRSGTAKSTGVSLTFDTSNAALRGRVPPEGIDVPVSLACEHALSLEMGGSKVEARLLVKREFALRVRDPAPQLNAFRRLSAVGIDFGTSATVAAFTHRGYRSLMRLGAPTDGSNPAENPTYLLVEDHESLWSTLAQHGEDKPEGQRRYPPLAGIVRASHSARDAIRESPNAVVGEIKTLPERVVLLDQSPQLRDRLRQSDFLLDEPRVRALVRTYAYVLGRAINRPGQDVFLQYWLTYPAEFEDRSKDLLEEEIRAGILLSIPEGVAASEVSVEMRATEPEAYAAEVCPELVSHPAIEPLVAKHGELRFAVFDFGGGTLDIACGRYRPATPDEEAASGCSTVIETLAVSGNDQLGGDYLTHELVWLAHQHESALPEMESKQVPMQRPRSVPENRLARAPHLYKRSLAGRQNKIRFERELSLEKLKFTRDAKLTAVPSLSCARLDASETSVECYANPAEALRTSLTGHLETRILEGAKLLASMLTSTRWGGEGDFLEQGVLVLLAGNSSRGEYVASALGKALGRTDLSVWRPDDPPEKLHGVVLYETPSRVERGVEVHGVTPKTAVALGALKIANREVHLVRAQQGFSYYVGDMKGFPPKFNALVPMGTLPSNADEWGPHWVEFGAWDARKPLRVSTQFEPNKMTSSDPRLLSIPTGLPPGSSGKLFVCVVGPTRIALHLQLADGENALRAELNLAPYLS